MAVRAICKIKHETYGQDASKAKVKPSALLALRQRAECFILHIANVRLCFNCFKEFTHECLVKAYLFQSITHPSTLLSRVRQFWMIFHANASVNRLILAKLTGICHLVSLFTICFSDLTVLYCNIALQMHFQCYMVNIAMNFS